MTERDAERSGQRPTVSTGTFRATCDPDAAVETLERFLGGDLDARAADDGRDRLAFRLNELLGRHAALARSHADLVRVVGAVARGDLTQTVAAPGDGDAPAVGEAAALVNAMVEQLARFASEVTRVARDVGTEGKLGGQATVRGVAGTWKDLTDHVNFMASNLTGQVRDIAEVTTAVARGDLSKLITVDVRGEMLELKHTINQMIANLRETTQTNAEQDRLRRASEERLRHQQEELRRTNEALAERAAQLALSSKYKSEFLANMSHELRTPLNSLLILARLLAENREGNLDARQVEFARTIHGAGTDLLALINDILDLSKVESGRIDVEVDEVRLDAVRDYVERNFRLVARDRGLDFAVELSPGLPPALHTDARRLQQILKNLLANAFKFTERGAVTLHVSPTPERGPGAVAFAVSDTGIGIPAHKHRIIFEAFQQADGTTSRRYGGTGLGLSISRELARVLGGEIRVESAPGAGSTFTLILPDADRGEITPEPPRDDRPRGRALGEAPTQLHRVAATIPSADTAPSRPPDPRLSGRRVLVVDDDVRNIFAIASVLERHGLEVAYAENGRRALARLAEDPPIDAVLMDVMMPEMDGYETTREIRRTPRFAALPVIALTARAMKGDREKCLAAGASDYVTKPVEPEALLGLLRAWLVDRGTAGPL